MSTCAPAPGRTLSDAVAARFAGTDRPGPPTIGIELELIPYRMVDHGVVPVDDLRGALAGLTGISFEPGGQLELNPPPRSTVTSACVQLGRLGAEVDRRLGAIGVAAAAIGVNPWHSPDQLGQQLRSPRYLAMDDHFARIGPAGRAFMRQTASTQVGIGLATGEDGMQQWRTATLIAPVLAALFDNSPSHGARTAICRAADPDRTWLDNPPLTIDAYAEFADNACPLDETFAGDDAVDAHLSTLFPPVRPRGTYLEFRALDALPMPQLRTAVSLVACLLGHPPTTYAAERLCAAADPQRPGHLAGRLLELADAAARELPLGYLPAGTRAELRSLAQAVSRSGLPIACR